VALVVHRWQTADASLDAIAAEVGCVEANTLRTLLRCTGRGV
jgi:hypothetical protein